MTPDNAARAVLLGLLLACTMAMVFMAVHAWAGCAGTWAPESRKIVPDFGCIPLYSGV